MDTEKTKKVPPKIEKESLLRIKEDTLMLKEQILEKIKEENRIKKENDPDTILMDKIKLVQSLIESTYGGSMVFVERYNVPKVFTDDIDQGLLRKKLFELVKQL